MSEKAKYSIRGYCSDSDGGYDDESTADTIKEAKERARAMMSEAHLRVVESTVPVIYVEIVRSDSGEVVADFGRSGRDSVVPQCCLKHGRNICDACSESDGWRDMPPEERGI